MSADRFLTDVAGELGEGTLRHDDGELRGRARVDGRRQVVASRWRSSRASAR